MVESDDLNKETHDTVNFYTPTFHSLDNFSAHIIRLWGKDFPTAEHAYQWRKFSITEPDIAMRILSAASPYAVKEISDAHKEKQPATWSKEKTLVMEEILRAKFQQHPDVRVCLERTGRKRIVENSPTDSFWGVGPEGSGRNMLGTIWMSIRATQ